MALHHIPHISITFVSPLSKCSTSTSTTMEAKKKEKEQYTSTTFSPNPHTFYPMFSTTMEFNEKNNARANKSCYNSFATREASCGYSDVPLGRHVFEKSETDSCSEGGGGDDEGVSLDELLLHDGTTKKKIEQLAAMVGVDSTEPAIVLTEVVKVIKHLKRINQFYLSA